ncbi:phosphonate metabolism transcriptional regulator PhnF [Skermanella pratensis]|uniref:phosphonate metabolism transcriptional regulator PhnF n=1 Tax=Skermanella pratensis TaxID=2233999 RepID=UPI00130158F9|nr:phosphonate metabolism transcriptional regulator PhnF [Skermanella pratensis]
MNLDRGAGIALWRQIAEELHGDIERGTFPPGSRLATEEELAARFGVNRHTVRRACALLQDQGLVRIEQGRGTFVQEGVIDYPLTERTRFSENIRRQARTPSGEVLRATVLPADAAAARALGLAVGDPVALVELLSLADGQPIGIAAHHFAEARFPDLIATYHEAGRITETLRRLGVPDYTRRTTRVTARLPDSYEMRHLRIARTTPVLVTEAVNIDPAGRPLEFGVTRFAGNRVQVVVDW